MKSIPVILPPFPALSWTFKAIFGFTFLAGTSEFCVEICALPCCQLNFLWFLSLFSLTASLFRFCYILNTSIVICNFPILMVKIYLCTSCILSSFCDMLYKGRSMFNTAVCNNKMTSIQSKGKKLTGTAIVPRNRLATHQNL